MTGGSVHPFTTRWNHSTHHFPRLAHRLPPTARRVLDVGCGEGSLCRYLARPGRLVVGADRDASILPGPEACGRFVVASADALPFEDEAFDAVTMSMVLHHVDAERGLVEAARVLAPGGVLLVLGHGRIGRVRDLAHEVRDVAAHQVLSRRHRWWDPGTIAAPPVQTWAAARATAHRLLPGSTYRRLALWRYLVEWRKPSPPRS